MGVIFNNMKKFEYLNITISIALILLIGLATGYSIGYYHATKNNFPDVKFVDDINQGVATVKLMEVTSGKLIGEVVGREARIVFSENDILTIEKGGQFEIPLNKVTLKNYYQIRNIPQDVQFVASKNGKYYYSIFDKMALNLVEKNRIYFSNAKEAEKMGYLKR